MGLGLPRLQHVRLWCSNDQSHLYHTEWCCALPRSAPHSLQTQGMALPATAAMALQPLAAGIQAYRAFLTVHHKQS